MNISAVIFDCDGVMFDSRKANENFYNSILSHFGLPPMTPEEIEFVHMNTAVESLNHIFGNDPNRAKAQEYRLKMDYTPFVKDMVMEPGLKELLDLLKPQYGLAVATNRSNTIGKVLEVNGLSSYFDIVVSSLDVRNPKPHPESIFKILDFFRLTPSQAIYLGDSAIDSETAKAGGVAFAAYKNKELPADYYVDHLMDLAEKVLRVSK